MHICNAKAYICTVTIEYNILQVTMNNILLKLKQNVYAYTELKHSSYVHMCTLVMPITTWEIMRMK